MADLGRDTGEAGPRPLYRQVRELIERYLGQDTYRQGRPLPSSRFLAEELGVSRNTVSTAYQELIAMGLVESRPRSGLYVAEPARRQAVEPVPAPERPSLDWGARLATSPAAGLPQAARHEDWTNFPYPFVAAQPDLRAFPVRGWLRALTRAMDGPHLPYSVRDAAGTDDPLLLEVLCRDVLPSRGVRAEPEQVLVTSGSQQGLALLAGALLGPGSRVAVENPGYVDAWQIFRRAGADLSPMAVDGRGAVLGWERDVDAVYLTPGHQHPTNVTLSPARRRAALERAAAYDTLIIEDDHDSEFRFRGRPATSLKSLDTEGRVIHLGTFSKFLAAGLRLGYVVGDAELVAELRGRRMYQTNHVPGHLQRALALFIEAGDFHNVLRRHRRSMRDKWQELYRTLGEELPFPVDPPPPGGRSIWVTGPAGLDTGELARTVRARGVLLDAGAGYFLQAAPPRNHMRLGFAGIGLPAIAPGVRLVAQAARRQLDATSESGG